MKAVVAEDFILREHPIRDSRMEKARVAQSLNR